MISKKLRQKFLDYFKEKGHLIVPSSPVIPYEDPTLLFTNAGMNQFKDLFLGEKSRDFQRAASIQKCVRAGGKHNDLENVGHTRRHLTFFEMMGNFSFGDYFKKEAIAFAWEVSTEVLGLDPKKIWPSVYEMDEEAFLFWTAYVPESRICRMGEKDNFWAMGETGPCGPCSELYYDLGETRSKADSPKEDPEGERFLEYWNLVFMEFNRREKGVLEKLPRPSIDTGMGLERLVSLIMGVDTVYATDILGGLITKVGVLFNKPIENQGAPPAPYCVIADHLRTLSFAIADGQQPSNVDRGYVLRKILRRAVRYGRDLGASDPFLAELVPSLVELMGDDYPELVASKKRIQEILTHEEALFLKTLKKGEAILHKIVKESRAHEKSLLGQDIFLLKDTFGFPVDEIGLMAKDLGLTLDLEGFHKLEKIAREKSREGQKASKEPGSFDFAKEMAPTLFLGYDKAHSESAILSLIAEGELKEFLQEGESGLVVLDRTPFYAEMGGQVGDMGEIRSEEGDLFIVEEAKSIAKGVTAHFGRMVKGRFEKREKVISAINHPRRLLIENNHTATHLLHYALAKVLGPHIKQAGSLVEEGRLRFDFSHQKPLSNEEIFAVEDLVNTMIRQNSPVESYIIPFEEASKKKEIKQFFGEKYGHEVRVIDIPFGEEGSKELCGGTHVSLLGRIGLFRIIKESGIAQGIRRIEAITGQCAEEFGRGREECLASLCQAMKAPEERAKERLKEIFEVEKQLKRELESYRKDEREKKGHEWLEKALPYKGRKIVLLYEKMAHEEGKALVELLFSKEEVAAIVALFTDGNKVFLLIRGKDAWVKEGHGADLWLKEWMPLIGAQGGGKALSAQGQGMKLDGVEALLETARNKILSL